MGCIIKYHINDSSLLGVWKIEENLDFLLQKVTLNADEKKRLKSFRNLSRKFEFLSVRALLAELTGNTASIVYNKNNKPFLKDGSMFISISHSHQLTAILLSVNEKVGVDLEFMSSNIAAVALKFINVKEKITKDPANRLFHLYLHWCAKEALYKICDKEITSIRKDISIEPFKVYDSGEITGSIHTDVINENFDLQYIKYDNYAVVWTKKIMENSNLNIPHIA
jgi:4'-phosphopantetheinyl transferase EntD